MLLLYMPCSTTLSCCYYTCHVLPHYHVVIIHVNTTAQDTEVLVRSGSYLIATKMEVKKGYFILVCLKQLC